MDEPLVVARGVSRRFGSGSATVAAVRGVSCAVYPRDRIALIGPSGSGKSTLLHLLGGLDAPTEGAVAWPALGPRAGLRPGKVADIFQGPSLLPPLTVLENARFPLALGGMPDREATDMARAALARFDLDRLADKLPEELSGGQAQRVAIVRAVVARPALVLADEPTGQLDSATSRQMLDRLLAVLDEQDAALVLSTHDPRIAERFDTVWSMRDGALRIDAAPDPTTTGGAPERAAAEAI